MLKICEFILVSSLVIQCLRRTYQRRYCQVRFQYLGIERRFMEYE